MQNPISKFRQSSINSEKQGNFSEKNEKFDDFRLP